MNIPGSPVHSHDCPQCHYLRTFSVDGGPVDWYECRGSIVGRYGDSSSAYWSMPEKMTPNAAPHGSPLLFAARKLTKLRQWDAAVRAWRQMRADRPLGVFYRYPEVPLPPDLLSLGGYRPKLGKLGQYPPAFWTLNRVAGGYG